MATRSGDVPSDALCYLLRRKLFDDAPLEKMLYERANASNGPCISAPDSGVSVWAIPTNEELMIAQHTQALVNVVAVGPSQNP